MIIMNILRLTIVLIVFVELSECTLLPPKDKSSKRNKGKVETKVAKINLLNIHKQNIYLFGVGLQIGPVNQDVFQRNLVVKNTKPHDVIRESGFYFSNTTRRRFTGDVLGYITPVNFCLLCNKLYTKHHYCK